jgi:hypothetical protein
MAFNLMDELEKITSKVTDKVASQAKNSAIETLEDPKFKASVNKFTKDWFNENKYILSAIIGSCSILSVLAIVNIISNFRSRR